MQTDGHHLGRRRSFAVQHIERVLEVVEEAVAGRETGRYAEFHVVGVERVGDHEVRFAVHARPVRQVVVVGVGVVEKTAFLDHQAPGVQRRRVPAVPAVGTRPGGALDRGDRAPHLGALFGFVHVLEADPAPAMRADLVLGGANRRRGGGVAFEREGRTEHGDRDLALAEHPHQTPKAGAAAVFVDRFDDQVALAGTQRRARHFGEVHLRRRVALADRVLRALLVVHHDLHGQPRTARPLRIGRRRAVSHEVARVVVAAHREEVRAAARALLQAARAATRPRRLLRRERPSPSCPTGSRP